MAQGGSWHAQMNGLVREAGEIPMIGVVMAVITVQMMARQQGVLGPRALVLSEQKRVIHEQLAVQQVS